MQKFFTSRFFFIVTIIAVVLVIVPSVLSFMGLSDYVRSTVAGMIQPLQKVGMSITNAIDGFCSYFLKFDQLIEENKQLKEQLNVQNDQLYRAQEMEEILNFLYDYMELKREHTDFMLEPASITGYDAGNYMTVFNLNKGSAHGITVDMPVVVSNTIVGYIVEVGAEWSKAVTILESASSVGAYISRTGQLGVVQGNFSLVSEGLCELKYVPADADVQVGDRVVSSGLGSVYPRGLIIGYVEEVIPDSYSRMLQIKVRSAVDYSALSQVMIVVDYEIYNQ